MAFEFRPAKRENVGLLLGLAAPTGAGKTYSGMRLAKGICGDKPFAVIDTEARRSLHYADMFRFDFVELKSPFSSDAYREAVVAAEEAGYPAILIDSFSHEHDGEGGMLDAQEKELEIMVKRALERGDRRKDWELEEAYKRSAWIEPKRARKRMMQRLLQCRSHLIFCLRADDKIDFVKDPQTGKTKVVPMKTLSGFDGWIPICDKRFPFELTASFILLPDKPGVPRPIKLQEQHKPFFPPDKPITEESGRALAEWARGASSTAQTTQPSTAKRSDVPAGSEPICRACSSDTGEVLRVFVPATDKQEALWACPNGVKDHKAVRHALVLEKLKESEVPA